MRAIDPRLLARARPARNLLAMDAAIGIVAALLVLAQAVLLADIGARSFHGASLGAVETLLVLLALVFAARGILAWAFEVAGRGAARRVLSQLRLELVEQRLRSRPAALDGETSVEVATLAVGGVDSLETAYARYLPQFVLAAIVPVAVLVLVAAFDPISAAVLLLTLPLVPVFMWLVGRYTAQRAAERWEALTTLAGHFLDVVQGLPTLRAFGRGEAQAKRIAEVGDEYRRTTMGTLRVAFLSGSVLELAATLGVALVAVTVGVRLADGSVGLRTALTVLLLAPELYQPLRNLAAQYHASADGLAVTNRLLDLLESPATVPGGAMPAPSPSGAAIELEHVSFAYPSREVPVLEDVDLTLAPGEVVALVGESGSGKSTLASLILCLAAPQSGSVRAGGIDLASCDVAAWRAQVAWAPQNATLFRGTVRDNVRLGAPEATDARVIAAARLAGIHETVLRLPRGYDTAIGEAGRSFSAGERQRLGLARAFLRAVPLLVLDEPTANLDAAAAAHVASSLETVRRDRTVLLITHRLELAERADRIVRLVHGRIQIAQEVAA